MKNFEKLWIKVLIIENQRPQIGKNIKESYGKLKESHQKTFGG